MSAGIAALLVVALVCGVFIGLLFQRTRSADVIASSEKRGTEAAVRLQDRERQVGELELRLQNLAGVDNERARLAAELQMERKSAAEKIALLEQAELRLRESFQTLSA